MRFKVVISQIILPIFFIGLSFIANGNNRLLFDHISTAKGLSHGTVFATLTDSKGFVWFCTGDGLNRYDGYEIKVFPPFINNQKSKVNHQFTSIVEDKVGRLWVGSSEGLYCFNYDDNRLQFVAASTSITEYGNGLNSYVTCLMLDHNDDLWMGSYFGAFKLNIGGRTIESLSNDDYLFFIKEMNDSVTLSDNHIFTIYEDELQRIWFSSHSNFIDCYDPEEDTFQQFLIDVKEIEHSKGIVKRLLPQGDSLWIYTEGKGLILWDRSNNLFQHQVLRSEGEEVDLEIIKSCFVDQEQNLWIGSDGSGLVLYNTQSQKLHHYQAGKNELTNLSSNAIYSIYIDNDQIAWIGTYLNGVNKLSRTKSDFGPVFSKPFSVNGLSNKLVTSFLEDHLGNIWVGTDGGGLNKLDLNTYSFSHYKPSENDTKSISTSIIMSLFQDVDHNIWIGSFNGGLNKFNPETEDFVTYWHDEEDPSTISSNHPWGFAQDASKNLWIATVNSGLNLLKYNDDTFFNYKAIEDSVSPYFICSDAITHLFIDSQKRLWIATETGLDYVDLTQTDLTEGKPTIVFNHFQYVENENTISSNRISFITEDHLGNLWFGTKSGGLNKFDPKTEIFKVYTVDDGLPHNTIQAILFDKKQNLWISTNNGIAKFDPINEHFELFNQSDGLQSNEFFKTSCLKTSDGMFLFGGVNGFNAFYPDLITRNKLVPRVVITKFKLFNNEVEVGQKVDNRIILKQSITETHVLNLKHRDNFISFEFSALNFNSPEKNQYAFQMVGFDANWVETHSGSRIATYTNLDPGKYTFKVKASNNNDVWNTDGASITIIIAPPWWRTWWFQLFFIAFLFGVIIIVYILRITSLQQQKKTLEENVKNRTLELEFANKNLKELNATKDKFMSIIAHDISSPFNTILGFSDLLKRNLKKWKNEEIQESINHIYGSSKQLYDLLQNLLQWSQSERGLLKVELQSINLNEVISATFAVFSYTAKVKNITIKLEMPDDTINVISDKQILQTILRNLMSNAIKFTHNDGWVKIQVWDKRDFCYVSISDNGQGISKEGLSKLFRLDEQHSSLGTNEEKGTGLGLVLVKEFVKKQGGELSVKSTVNEGSSFTFSIPRKK